MVATSPLRSGHEIRSMAEFFIIPEKPEPRRARRYTEDFLGVASGPAWRSSDLRLQGFHDLSRGVRPLPSGQSSTRMRSAPAQVQIFDGRAVPRPIEQWPHRKELIE